MPPVFCATPVVVAYLRHRSADASCGWGYDGVMRRWRKFVGVVVC